MHIGAVIQRNEDCYHVGEPQNSIIERGQTQKATCYMVAFIGNVQNVQRWGADWCLPEGGRRDGRCRWEVRASLPSGIHSTVASDNQTCHPALLQAGANTGLRQRGVLQRPRSHTDMSLPRLPWGPVGPRGRGSPRTLWPGLGPMPSPA